MPTPPPDDVIARRTQDRVPDARVKHLGLSAQMDIEEAGPDGLPVTLVRSGTLREITAELLAWRRLEAEREQATRANDRHLADGDSDHDICATCTRERWMHVHVHRHHNKCQLFKKQGTPQPNAPSPISAHEIEGTLNPHLTPGDVMCATCSRPRKQHNNGIDAGLGSCAAFKLPMPLLAKTDVNWVVNDLAELGVKIADQFFWLYKGVSLVYGHMHDAQDPMMWRGVYKREFGECCHPLTGSAEDVQLKNEPKHDTNGRYIAGTTWRPMPPQPTQEP